MNAGQLIADARAQTGLTQTELASRMGTHQSVVARWESGKTQPSFETVARAVSAAGLELTVTISKPGSNKRSAYRLNPTDELARAVMELEQLSFDQARLRWIKGR